MTFQHTLYPPSQYTSQPTHSTHPLNSPTQPTHSTHPLNSPSQPTLSTPSHLLGVPVVDPMLPKQENGKPGVRMAKDYLRPVVLKSPEAVKESIPKVSKSQNLFVFSDGRIH